jgi:hypothetical protein
LVRIRFAVRYDGGPPIVVTVAKLPKFPAEIVPAAAAPPPPIPMEESLEQESPMPMAAAAATDKF